MEGIMQLVTDTTRPRAGFYRPGFYNVPSFEGKLPDKKTYTYADYERLPEGTPYQLIGGQLVMTPSPIPYHQEISRKLEFKMLAFVEERTLGHVYDAPLDVYFSDSDVFQPDIIFIRKEREGIIGETKIEGSPDIVIEILSPSTAYYDLRNKFRIYEQCGVSEYWIVDPGLKRIEVYENKEKRFEIYMEAEGEGNISSKVLEGFSVALDEVF
jgi:Uma2 family endonuclease